MPLVIACIVTCFSAWCSAPGDVEYEAHATAHGSSGLPCRFLGKPYDFDDLDTIVRDLCGIPPPALPQPGG